RGIGFTGEVIMPWVVGSGHQARVGVDDNRPGVHARRQTGRDGIGGAAGGAGVRSVERVVDGRTRGGRDLEEKLTGHLAARVAEDRPGEKGCVYERQPVAEPLSHEAQLGVIFPRAEIEGVAVCALDSPSRIASPPGSFPRLGLTKLVEHSFGHLHNVFPAQWAFTEILIAIYPGLTKIWI